MKKFLLSVLIMMGTTAVFAQVPGTLSYQGILIQSTGPQAGEPVVNGPHSVLFKFFDAASGGTELFFRGPFLVDTYKGMFTFIIGSGSPAGNTAIPASIGDSQVWVEVTADGVVQTPRIQLTTVPYAFKAQSANTMDAANLTGTLNPARIAAGTIDNTKLASGIDAGKLTTGTLPAARIGNDAIDNAKMADNSITSAEITDGTIVNADINASAAIAVNKLAAGTANQVLTTISGIPTWTTPAAGGSVTNVATGTGLTGGPITTTGTISIATGGVTTALLADNSVNSAKIVDGTIATADLADGSVTVAKLASGAAVSGTGATNRVAFWSGTSALSSNANLFWDNATSRLGIGTATPAFPIDVTLVAGASTAKFGATRGICLVANSPMVGFNIYWGSGYTYHSSASGGIITFSQEVADGFSFNTAPSGSAGAAATLTSRMSILNNGNVGIGTTNPTSKLDVSGNINVTGTITASSNIQTGAYYYFSAASGKYIFNVSGSYTGVNDHFIPNFSNTYDLGTTTYRWRTLYTNTSPNVSSDYRLKKEIKILNYGLTEVLSLRPVTYVLKDDTEGSKHLGLIAQEVRNIIPEIVSEEKSGEKLLGLTYTELIPVLINAIKEQQALITHQNTSITDMKAELSELRKMVMAQQPKGATASTATTGNE